MGGQSAFTSYVGGVSALSGGSASDKTHKRNASSHDDWLEKRPFVRFINIVVNIG